MIASLQHDDTHVRGERSGSRDATFGYVVAGVMAAAAVALRLALDPPFEASSLTFAAVGLVTAVSALVGITTRRRYAQALASAREREQRYAAVFASSSCALALARLPRGVVVEANRAMLELFGYRRDEALGRTTIELGITPSPAYAAMTWELGRGGSVCDFECVRRTADDVQTLAISMNRVMLSGDRHAVIAIRDITEQRRLEEVLRESGERIERTGLVEP